MADLLKNTKYNAIRLFVSSTFVDMKTEREYFNDIIVPKLRNLCRDKGVSFFSVDLRWGVTEEDIENDRLVNICLEEVDKCQPFFLGIIGNRYGSKVSSITPALLKKYPWIVNETESSYTELEIAYNFLKQKNQSNSLFLFKANGSDDDSDDAASVARLKSRILEAAEDRVYEYKEMADFEERILEQVTLWLNDAFGNTDIHLQRAKLYENEISEQCSCNISEEKSIYSCITETDTTILLHGGPTGKTSLLNKVAKRFKNSIVINCCADEANSSWLYLLNSIYDKLVTDDNIKSADFDDFKKLSDASADSAILSAEAEEKLRISFLNMLKSIKCKNEMILVINDIDYISGNKSEYLHWLPSEAYDKLKIVCSSNDSAIINSARVNGWQLVELKPMSHEDSKKILDYKLERIGKNPKNAQALLSSAIVGYPAYLITAIDFLNAFGSFDSIEALSSRLSEAKSFDDFYKIIFEIIKETRGSAFFDNLMLTLGAISLSVKPLGEDGCYYVVSAIQELAKFEWTNIATVMSALRFTNNGGKLPLALKNFIDGYISSADKAKINDALGSYWVGIYNSQKNINNIPFLKNAIYHYSNAHNTDAILSLLSDSDNMVHLLNYDVDVVRLALATVMYYSDRNISKFMVNCFNHFKEQHYDTDILKTACINLYKIRLDFNIVKEAKTILNIFENSPEYSSIFLDIVNAQIQKDVFNVNVILESCDTAEAALEKLEQMASEAEASPEKVAVCKNKMAEVVFRCRGVNALEYCEQALTSSIKAASVPNILNAYKTKLEALLQKRLYDEAIDTIHQARQWAKKMGYLFYEVSFANSEMIALYRIGRADEAVSIGKKYIELCNKWGRFPSVVTFQRGIGAAYIISGKYSLCIQFLEECLKNKNLTSADRILLTEMLASAYCNNKQYSKSCSCLSKIIKEPDLTELKKELFSLKLAVTTVLNEGVVNSKSLSHFSSAFQLAKARGNFDLIHRTLDDLYPLLTTAKEGDSFLNKWSDVAKKDEYLRNSHEYDQLYPNDFELLAVHNLPVVKLNIKKLENSYKIAMERAEYDEAIKTAFEISKNCAYDNIKKAEWCYNALLAGLQTNDNNRITDCALKGVECIICEGVVTDCDMFNKFTSHLDSHYREFVSLWVKASSALYNSQSSAVTYLCDIISSDNIATPSKLHCIADLSNLIKSLPPDEFNKLLDVAENNEKIYSKLRSILTALTLDMSEGYQKFFGKKAIESSLKSEKKFSSFITNSGYFEISGHANFVEYEGSEHFVVKPKGRYPHLDHVWATVRVDNINNNLHVLCITDIVFNSTPDSLMDSVKAYVKNNNLTNVEITKNNYFRCIEVLKGKDNAEIEALYNNYARNTIKVIRDMDELASGF